MTELVTLLPCHGLEDFPTHHQGEMAGGLLASWSALWHPVLIRAAGAVPGWHRADDPPPPVEGMLLAVSFAAEDRLPEGYLERATAAGGRVLRGTSDRGGLVAMALEAIGKEREGAEYDPELAADFLALGSCHLLTELLTRRMRYMSHLDEGKFRERVLAAAEADDPATIRAALAAAFELLQASRSHFYPVDCYLLDFTLVAESTCGEGMRRQLAMGQATSLLASGEVIERWAENEGESFAAMRRRLADGSLCVVGGEWSEIETPQLSLESWQAQLEAGGGAYQRHLERRPTVFGRRRFGLSLGLPELLVGMGYKAALHFTLDDGRFPQAERSKVAWEGLSATSIPAVGRIPLDARDPGSMLSLPEKLGESMDYDHVSLVSFAHWPGEASIYYQDLVRAAAYAPVLGKFVTVEQLFSTTDSPGQFTHFRVDQYQSPFLRQQVAKRQANPLTAVRDFERRNRKLLDAQALSTLDRLLGGSPTGEFELAKIQEVRERVIKGGPQLTAEGGAELDAAAEERLRGGVDRYAAKLTGKGGEKGILIVNPHSFSRRIGVDVSSLAVLPEVGGPVLAASDAGGRKLAVVEAPPMGFAWIGPGSGGGGTGKGLKSIVQGNVLLNEHCEVTIDEASGGIRSVRDLKKHGNRLSQQVALRMGAAGGGEVGRGSEPGGMYTTMVSESISATIDSPICGEIRTQGRLVDGEGGAKGEFVQRTRLWKGSRTIELEIELLGIDADRLLAAGADPWGTYYACRFAWGDSLAELRRDVHGTSQPTELVRLEAPRFVEIVSGQTRTAIFPRGLPYHARSGSRMLDTLLVTAGEGARRFSLAVGVDVERPWEESLGLETEWEALQRPGARPGSGASGWLFFVESRRVMATHWEPLVEEGQAAGFRVRLVETAGIGVCTSLVSFRRLANARRINFRQEPQGTLAVDGERVHFDLGRHEWIEVEARFA